MKKIVRKGESKVLLDTDKDVIMWTGGNFEGGHRTDLHLHECKSGGAVFYRAHYTQWQGEENFIKVLTLDEAQRFVEDHYEDIELTDDWLKELGLLDPDSLE